MIVQREKTLLHSASSLLFPTFHVLGVDDIFNRP